MLLRLLALPFLFTTATWACLNDSRGGTDLDGHDAGSRHGHDAHYLRRSLTITPSELRHVPAKASAAPTAPAKRLEAEALDLVYAGDHAAALPLLQAAEAAAPGDYSVAANLGTVHELLGDHAAALRWIGEAIRRNPAAHHGTEWVHVLVLKAKLRDSALDAPAPRPPLIDVPDRVAPDTPLLVDGVTRSTDEVRGAIFYQLQERMVFVKPPDPYVADLLFALARLNASLVNVEAAAATLPLAETYGYSDTTRAAALREDIRRAHLKANTRAAASWIAGLVAVVAALCVAHRRRWFFLTRAAYDAHRARAAQAARAGN